MEKIILCFAMILAFKSNAQKEEIIKIKNFRTHFAIEAGYLDLTLYLDGNSQLIESDHVKEKYGIDIGTNVEYFLFANNRKASISSGLHYTSGSNPIAFRDYEQLDGYYTGNLKLQYLRLPLMFYLRLFKIENFEGVGIVAGANFNYLIDATVKPGQLDFAESDNYYEHRVTSNVPVTEAFKRFGSNLVIGGRLAFGFFYMHFESVILPRKKIFNEEYADYSDTNAKFEEKYWIIGLGVYLN